MRVYLGMLATVLCDRPAAEGHLAAALASARAMGSAPYEAVAHLETARMLHRLGQPRDHAAALRHADAALDIAGRLGMGPVGADAARVRAAMASVPVLSAREDQVAGLVAQGLSNRQIATRLHLSERTVENHVAHAMTKLGFDSRARLASWHATRGVR
jgi:DNA-binding CsgD family transcriptional regulator